MNRKYLPLLLMLSAGAFTAIMTTVFEYSLKDKLLLLLGVLLLFCFLGSLVKSLLDYFDKQNAKKAEEDGEVIEKDAIEKEAESLEQGGDENG